MTVRQIVALLGWIAVLAAGWFIFIGRVENSLLSFTMLALFGGIAMGASMASTTDWKAK